MSSKADLGTMRRKSTADTARPLSLEAVAGVEGQPGPADVIALPHHGLISRGRLREIYAADLAVLADEARQAGYQEGLKQAEMHAMESASHEAEAKRHADEQSETRLAEKLQDLDRVITALQGQRDSLLHEAEGAIIELMYGCLARLLGAMAFDGSLVCGLVSKALEDMPASESLMIRVSIGDHAALDESGWMEQQSIEGRSVRWMPDGMLRTGECLIETRRGTLDIGLDTQLSALRDALVSVHNHPKVAHAS